MRLKDACRYRNIFKKMGYSWRIWTEVYPNFSLQINYASKAFPYSWTYLYSVHDAKRFLKLAQNNEILPR